MFVEDTPLEKILLEWSHAPVQRRHLHAASTETVKETALVRGIYICTAILIFHAHHIFVIHVGTTYLGTEFVH